MTIEDLRAQLLAAGWNVLYESIELRTLIEPGSNQLLTFAGHAEARIPQTTLNDILWTAGAL